MRGRGWFVKSTHGNEYQSGFPDLFSFHREYGMRWIEVKNPDGFRFTPAQLETFHQMAAAQCGIWVLMSDAQHEYEKLFKPCNWYTYLSGFS